MYAYHSRTMACDGFFFFTHFCVYVLLKRNHSSRLWSISQTRVCPKRFHAAFVRRRVIITQNTQYNTLQKLLFKYSCRCVYGINGFIEYWVYVLTQTEEMRLHSSIEPIILSIIISKWYSLRVIIMSFGKYFVVNCRYNVHLGRIVGTKWN